MTENWTVKDIISIIILIILIIVMIVFLINLSLNEKKEVKDVLKNPLQDYICDDPKVIPYMGQIIDQLDFYYASQNNINKQEWPQFTSIRGFTNQDLPFNSIIAPSSGEICYQGHCPMIFYIDNIKHSDIIANGITTSYSPTGYAYLVRQVGTCGYKYYTVEIHFSPGVDKRYNLAKIAPDVVPKI